MPVFETTRASPAPAVPAVVPSPSQREAIEAPAVPTLVLAGPGAGKTFCLIERIRFLIECLDVDPTRICAFTFTNKAADEIATRLARVLGPQAEGVKRRTIHAFCAELLREHATRVGLTPGFGIADEEYQLGVLRRLNGSQRWHRRLLTTFSTHRLRGDPLRHNDAVLFARYEERLARRNMVDFDTLVLKTRDLLGQGDAAEELRERWTVLLVDEFQDLNPVQYRIIRELAARHRHVFAVGDDEQSIYAWAGADPALFTAFMNDFAIARPVYLRENRRCPRQVFDVARRLVAMNTPIFDDREPPRADRTSPFEVSAVDFETDEAELAWLVEDIRLDRAAHGHDLGDVALLYRKHEIGDYLEAALLTAGTACRLVQGHALAEEPVVGYAMVALRAIADPKDDVCRDAFLAASLPPALVDEARARAERSRHDLRRELRYMASRLPRGDERARQIRLALYRHRNLEALGRAHTSLDALLRELLSQKVGANRSALDDRHDDLSDPLAHEEVVALEARLRAARERDCEVVIPRLDGVEIALKGMLVALGFRHVQLGGDGGADAEHVSADDAPTLGLPLGLFKALQLLEIGEDSSAFRDFTVIDLETTGDDTEHCEVVEVAAVRVRDGRVTDEFNTLVRPRVPISRMATRTHGIREADVTPAPRFEDIWPKLAAFCGDDIVVAHNGYEFDFVILKRMVTALGWRFELCTYDTLPLARELFPTSRKLTELARVFGVDPGRSHRALHDARTLAHVFLALGEAKLARVRKTALSSVLDHLGIALALSDARALCAEAQLLRDLCRPYALGRYSGCLEAYERERGEHEELPGVDEVIDALGGVKLMLRIRAEKGAEERYPMVMERLRRLIAHVEGDTLADQIGAFLERVVLSARSDGVTPDRDRVNLLTLHSTKGLEFSRVYVVGVEDAQLPGSAPGKEPSQREVEEARRLLYVGMTRAKERLVLTRAAVRRGKPTGGHRFLDEMGLAPVSALAAGARSAGG